MVTVAGKRAPVQGDYVKEERKYKNKGSISWKEFLEIYTVYVKMFGGSDQSAERIAERGGFSYNEIIFITGQAPTTWVAAEDT